MSCPPQNYNRIPVCGNCQAPSQKVESGLKACLTANPNISQVISHGVETGKISKVQASQLQSSSGSSPELNKLKAAFLKGKLWRQKDIHIGFFRDRNFSEHKKNWVIKVITDNILYLDGNKDKKLIGLNFLWDRKPVEQCDVRITFDKGMGAWSYIGIDAKNVPGNQQTMNLGWIDDFEDYDFNEAKGTGVVVVHEFGHMLGMIHEHTRGDFKPKWNCPFLVDSLSKPPNSWDWCTVYNNILQTYDRTEFNGSDYDPKSVMHYFFDNKFFCDKPNLPHVTKLSYNDKVWLNKSYPPAKVVTISSSGGDETEGGSSFLKWVNTILLVLLIVGFGVLFYKLWNSAWMESMLSKKKGGGVSSYVIPRIQGGNSTPARGRRSSGGRRGRK